MSVTSGSLGPESEARLGRSGRRHPLHPSSTQAEHHPLTPPWAYTSAQPASTSLGEFSLFWTPVLARPFASTTRSESGAPAANAAPHSLLCEALAKPPSDNFSAIFKLLLVFPPGNCPAAQFCTGAEATHKICFSAFPSPPAR